MISCIICSRKKDISEQLRLNVEETIGCDYELIIIDNSENIYTSIFSAYNEGLKKAKGDILCFMHDDILYHSNQWGKQVEKIFQDESVGLVGVLGTQFMPDTLSAWWWSGCTVGHVLQSYNCRLGNDCYINGNPITQDVDAVIVDGLWYCVRKNMFDRIKYDSLTYNGFHCYDHDLCMQILEQGKRVVVAAQIIIEHASEGNVGTQFLEQLQVFYNKWKLTFPITRGIELNEIAEDRIKNVVKQLAYQTRLNISIKQSKKYRYATALSNIFHDIKSNKSE